MGDSFDWTKVRYVYDCLSFCCWLFRGCLSLVLLPGIVYCYSNKTWHTKYGVMVQGIAATAVLKRSPGPDNKSREGIAR